METRDWGSRFPVLMNTLYHQSLLPDQLDAAIEELKSIQEELKAYDPSMIVWDIENLPKLPPWGNRIADRITDLSNYFHTSKGEDLFDLFFKALNAAKSVKKAIGIQSI